jgi:hypothetical protein
MPRQSDLHDQHDPLLVVALAAGDLAGTDRDRATALVAACADCSFLHDDLLAVARATAALPAARRPRDFRLTPADAARLRPLGWRRFVAAFAGPRLAFTRQLGVGLTTLGLAGLLFTALPGMSLSLGGSTAAAPSAAAAQEYFESDKSLAAPSAADVQGEASGGGVSSAPVAAQASPAASGLSPAGPLVGTNDGDATGRSALTATNGAVPGSESGPSPLLVGSVAALAIGVALLLARRLGRRLSSS